jgi:hypothetical protein
MEGTISSRRAAENQSLYRSDTEAPRHVYPHAEKIGDAFEIAENLVAAD